MALSKVLQLRRGTASQNDGYTGSPSEVTVDTENNELRLHDAQRPGGYRLPPLVDSDTREPAQKRIVLVNGIPALEDIT